MHVVIVSISVKHDRIDKFLAATLHNVRETLREPGVRRFDLLREAADSNQFLLIEVYRRPEDHSAHKETAHYRRWADEVEPLLAKPRSRSLYDSCFPHESGWE